MKLEETQVNSHGYILDGAGYTLQAQATDDRVTLYASINFGSAVSGHIHAFINPRSARLLAQQLLAAADAAEDAS